MIPTFTALFILAVLVEGIVEYFVAVPNARQPWLKYVSLAIAVLVCIFYKQDLLASLGLNSIFPFVGEILTGFVISRGSNYLNDFISRVRTPSPAVVVDSAATVNGVVSTSK